MVIILLVSFGCHALLQERDPQFEFSDSPDKSTRAIADRQTDKPDRSGPVEQLLRFVFCGQNQYATVKKPTASSAARWKLIVRRILSMRVFVWNADTAFAALALGLSTI